MDKRSMWSATFIRFVMVFLVATNSLANYDFETPAYNETFLVCPIPVEDSKGSQASSYKRYLPLVALPATAYLLSGFKPNSLAGFFGRYCQLAFSTRAAREISTALEEFGDSQIIALAAPLVTGIIFLGSTEILLAQNRKNGIGILPPIYAAIGAAGRFASTIEKAVEPHTDKDWIPPLVSGATVMILAVGLDYLNPARPFSSTFSTLRMVSMGTSVYRFQDAFKKMAGNGSFAQPVLIVLSLGTALALMQSLGGYHRNMFLGAFIERSFQAGVLNAAGMLGPPSWKGTALRTGLAFGATKLFSQAIPKVMPRGRELTRLRDTLLFRRAFAGGVVMFLAMIDFPAWISSLF